MQLIERGVIPSLGVISLTKEEFTVRFLKEQQRRKKMVEYDFIDFKSNIKFKTWKKNKKR